MISDLITSITAYSKALNLISKLRLWKYILLPGAIAFALAMVIFYIAYGLSDNIGDWLTGWYPWEWGRSIIDAIADVFGGLLILALGLIVFKQLVMVLIGPFMSPLSEKVERHLLGIDQTEKFSFKTTGYQVVRGVRIAIRNLFWELFFTILLLILGLFPLFTPFTTAGIFLIQAYYFGFGSIDFALERHYGKKDTVRFVKRHRGMAIGNGLLTTLALMTVVGFLFILPIGVIAATIEVSKKIERSETA